MLSTINATLEARNPERGHYRSYRIDVGQDLFGHWLMDVTNGRIGADGHLIRYVVANAIEARSVAPKLLDRRKTATRRIGTTYRLLELNDPYGWLKRGRMAEGKSFQHRHCRPSRPPFLEGRLPRIEGRWS